jgi:site-specific DNA-methyltransferase (adenine-specific)
MTTQIICGNNIELLKQYPDNYFDSIVTDAPYGLGKEPNAVDLMKDWVEKGYHEISGTGFMGKDWDAFVPQPLFWKEAFRVLKHGGHVLSFFGTRTYDWGVMAMRFAGFEVRDTIVWHYGSGFPKSHNISKALDKLEGAEREVIGKKERGNVEEAKERGAGFLSDPANRNNTKQFGYGTELITAPSTDAAKQWDGWGSALKPASELIVLARKPLEKGLSIAENVIKWGVGGINIDGCRIGFTDNVNLNAKQSTNNLSKVKFFDDDRNELETPIETYKTNGRFPANVIFSHHEDCVCNGCVEDCPIRILDEQSIAMGMHSAGNQRQKEVTSNYNSTSYHAASTRQMNRLGDKGGASRFFYTAKSSKGERNKGLEEFDNKPPMYESHRANYENTKGIETPYAGTGRTGNENRNNHPTVKPIKLMQYLVRLITPPNGIVLDPFNGSGTTGIAAKLEGFNYVGLELDPEYCKISEARIAAWEIDKPEIDNQLSLF